MSFKYIKLDGLQLITYIHYEIFFCLDEINKRSYSESLSVDSLKQRLRKLNVRMGFSITALHEALNECQPVKAMFTAVQENGAPTETDVVLCLKYRVKDAPALLKWEWNLKRVRRVEFYRRLMIMSLGHTVSLGNCQEYLTAIIAQKDKEIQQYRNEGAVLRRTTVATKLFDVNGFLKQHKTLLNNVVSYGQCVQAVGGSVITFSTHPSAMQLESPNGTSVEPADVATTTPCSTTDMGASKTLSPRNRKRNAMQAGILHVQRMALQRRCVTQLEYKNTESQEDDQEHCAALIKPDYFSEVGEEEVALHSSVLKNKPATCSSNIKLPMSTNDEEEDYKDLDDTLSIKDLKTESDGEPEDELNTSSDTILSLSSDNEEEDDKDLDDTLSIKDLETESDGEPEDELNTSCDTIKSLSSDNEEEDDNSDDM